MSRRVWVFAGRSDLLRVLEWVERRVPLVYRQCFRDTPDVPTWSSVAAIEDLGTAVAGGYIGQKCYLVLPASVPFHLREVELAAGGKRHFVDQLLNPASVTLRAGGLYQGACIVMGEFGTVTARQHGFDLLEAIRRVVRAAFRRVADAYVGPEAYALGESGVRLTDSTRAPADRCLALPSR